MREKVQVFADNDRMQKPFMHDGDPFKRSAVRGLNPDGHCRGYSCDDTGRFYVEGYNRLRHLGVMMHLVFMHGSTGAAAGCLHVFKVQEVACGDLMNKQGHTQQQGQNYEGLQSCPIKKLRNKQGFIPVALRGSYITKGKKKKEQEFDGKQVTVRGSSERLETSNLKPGIVKTGKNYNSQQRAEYTGKTALRLLRRAAAEDYHL